MLAGAVTLVDVVIGLVGFAAGVVVSQLGLVVLLVMGRRLLGRRRRHGSPPPARGWAPDELPGER